MPEIRKQTCGEFYREAINLYGTTPETHRIFASGFISGQAEKVYLGSCRAAMFRPSIEHRAMVMLLLGDICTRYGLCMIELTAFGEFWICRTENIASIRRITDFIKDSPLYHTHRAMLCGIPYDEIDFQFQERKGYGEKCD